ncbi:hypothetical protein ASPFODRAFT_54205 [Aspergillus luchuensis CBS 106.47]|uniref:CCHC-type domain-containing protein n=1 Tax=Aspergillus luchuensis (strain CBS 106.47) TaxID=1137211 RepID=A0A1M3SZP5_ASPLC|nr:hypothetical protein ASPFODRAFT_54205 [Aspergillus luchuensis CBS 106.47]
MNYRPWRIDPRHRNPTPSHALRTATRRSFAKSNPCALQSILRDPRPMQIQPSNIRTLSSWNTTPTTFTDTLYCTIDTSKMADTENKRPSAGPIRTAVVTEIRTMESYTNWRCRAVTIALLSRKENAKAYGSMAVYLAKGSDARRLLADGFFHAGGESGVTSTFEYRPRPMQCYNCQEIGHKAFQCKNAQKCAKCAAEGHHHSGCDQTIPKCIPCGGPHESYSKHCRKLYPSYHE